MKAYFLSGLGADERAFEKIKLPAEFEIVHIPWITQLKDESLVEYAVRISSPINCKEPFLLAGLSFGGIVATEIAKIKKPHLLILFSTAATKLDLPVLYRLAGKLQIARLIPPSSLRMFPVFLHWFFGATLKEQRSFLVLSLIKQILTFYCGPSIKLPLGKMPQHLLRYCVFMAVLTKLFRFLKRLLFALFLMVVIFVFILIVRKLMQYCRG